MSICLGCMTWQAIASLATFLAVVVALMPIYRDWRRAKDHAMSLRVRLGSKLMLLRPSLRKVAQGGYTKHPGAILSKEKFEQKVEPIGDLMSESFLLKTKEHGKLRQTFENLELCAGLYETSHLTAETAEHMLSLIDGAISEMEKELTSVGIEKPWEKEEVSRGSRACLFRRIGCDGYGKCLIGCRESDTTPSSRTSYKECYVNFNKCHKRPTNSPTFSLTRNSQTDQPSILPYRWIA